MRVGVVVGVVVVLGLAAGFSARAHGADAPPLEAPPVIRSGAPAAGASGEPTVEILVGDGMAVRDLLLAVSSAAQRTIVWEPQDKAIATRRIVGSPRQRTVDPIICEGRRMMHFDDRDIYVTGDAITVRGGCELFITNSRIVATGTGVVVRDGIAHIDNSYVEGTGASFDAAAEEWPL